MGDRCAVDQGVTDRITPKPHLFVHGGRQGGKPEVRGMRQKLGGSEFEGCMKEALLGVDFHKPVRPTVFSYSMRFDVK